MKTFDVGFTVNYSTYIHGHIAILYAKVIDAFNESLRLKYAVDIKSKSK